MTDERRGDELQRLWQAQPKEETMMSLDALRAYARKLERRVAWRNGREYVAAVIVTIMFGQAIWNIPVLAIRIACAMIIAATAFVVYHLHKHGRSRPLPQDFGSASALEFLRGELVRQRDLLRRVWLWYEAPFLPGAALFLTAVAMQAPRRGWLVFAIGAAWVGAVLLGIHLLNAYAARRIQRRLDALPRPD